MLRWSILRYPSNRTTHTRTTQAYTFKSKIIFISSAQCCSEGNINACIVCFRPYICYAGKCYPPTRPPTKPPTTTQPTTTTPPTTYKPCGEKGECPERSKCQYDVCIQDY
ncbi:unnamed protein product [Meloidogyne enterolobii]|uniref:Uncharacterized protein n=1 Tax=Meloidogyne enterolobii TaxID=390850 RepID=A0ACB0ZH35_MELEN